MSPQAPGASRRDVLTGGAAFVLAFALPGRARAAAPLAAPLGALSGPRFNAFLAVGTDDVVTAILAQTEGGQGSSTGMPQVIASELGADWERVRVQFSTEQRDEFVNPVLYRGLVLTAGSTSISAFYGAMRTAAAATREMFVAAAARRWSVAAAECTVANSVVTHAASGRSLTFGALALDAAREPVPADPPLRTLSALPYVGRRMPRLDVPAKCDGSARFGIDAEVPGMLHAAVRHGPVRGSTVATLDAAAARSMPGVRLVMAVPQGVAAVAEQRWQAVKALAAVRETYDEDAALAVSSADIDAALRAGLAEAGTAAPQNHGDVPAAMAAAATVLEAEFRFPILAHACMEPVSCTASVAEGRCEIWLSTKCPTLDAGFAAEALGIPPTSVVVHNAYQGGDFGRRSGREHVTEAVLLSKATGRPVKVIWPREEDLHIDQFRTSVLARARISLGTDGMPVAYEVRSASDGMWRSLFPEWYSEHAPVDLPLLSLVGSPYGIPNEAGAYVVVPHGIRIGSFRGNSESHNTFVLETMIDEAAHAAGRDSLAYRIALLAADPRSVTVLERAGTLAGWGEPGRRLGLAYYQSAFYGCRLAVIVEVADGADGIRVTRATAVCDSGLVVNPMLAERCIEGGVVFALSNLMFEQITLDGGAAQQRNFADYRLLRMNEAPEVTVEIVSVGDVPGGFGEIGTIAGGSALANALFSATGRRFRTAPFAANGAVFA